MSAAIAPARREESLQNCRELKLAEKELRKQPLSEKLAAMRLLQKELRELHRIIEIQKRLVEISQLRGFPATKKSVETEKMNNGHYALN